MKVLFVHNHYGTRSGEEVMLERIMSLLASRGHHVDSFFAYSTDIKTAGQKLSAAASGIWSRASRARMRRTLKENRPDVVQIQNLFPLISPAVLPIISRARIPVVMRLSNYRLVCPNGLFLSHGKVCERCRGGREYQCILRNCESSLFKSTAYAARNWTARRAGLYSGHVTRYYAQTGFQRDLLASEGFDGDRIDVIPNMVETVGETPLPKGSQYVAFVGRLSAEKGIDTLLDAARLCPDVPFRFAGDPGIYANREDLPPNVALLGKQEKAELDAFYANAAMLVVPSIWYEGFPGVILEAMSHSLPVITTDIGGLPGIVDHKVNGLVVPPAEAQPLAGAIKDIWCDRDTRLRLGTNAADKARTEYSMDRYYDRLMETYAIARSSV